MFTKNTQIKNEVIFTKKSYIKIKIILKIKMKYK